MGRPSRVSISVRVSPAAPFSVMARAQRRERGESRGFFPSARDRMPRPRRAAASPASLGASWEKLSFRGVTSWVRSRLPDAPQPVRARRVRARSRAMGLRAFMCGSSLFWLA